MTMKIFLFLLLCLVCPSLRAQSLNVVASSIVESTTTSTTGTAFVQLTKNDAVQVRVFNNTGTTLDFRFYDKGKAIPMPTATQLTLRGIVNVNQISVKRDDNSNTPVTIYYIIER